MAGALKIRYVDSILLRIMLLAVCPALPDFSEIDFWRSASVSEVLSINVFQIWSPESKVSYNSYVGDQMYPFL